MKYLGDFTAGKMIRHRFNTHKADGTPITLAGTPVISVYKGNTTESVAGVTLTVDYDARTGLHDVVVDTAADGAFYAAGNDFDITITAGTVDGVSVVGVVLATFSLANRSALRPTAADRTLTVTATGAAGIDWSNVENPGSTVALAATTISTGQAVASVAGSVGSISGVTFPTNFNLLGINGSGHLSRVVLVDTVTALASTERDTLVDLVWDEPKAGHVTPDTFGDMLTEDDAVLALVNSMIEFSVDHYQFKANALDQAPGGTAPTVTEIRQELDANSTKLAAINDDGVIHAIPSDEFGNALQGQVLDLNANGQPRIDMTQAVPTTNTANTLGDALNAARAQGFGKWTLVGTTLTLYAPDGTTAVRTFTLDSAISPTSRT